VWLCACFSVHSFGYTPRTNRNETKRCSKRVELSRVGSVGLDRFGLVWPGSGSGYGFGFCFSYCPGCGCGSGSCRFWQLWLRLWAVCFRLEPSVRFMGHLSEHSKWLTANVGCCCSFVVRFFRFYCCQWLLVCCSVAASDCQSVWQSVSLPYCKWMRAEGAGQGLGPPTDCCSAGKSSQRANETVRNKTKRTKPNRTEQIQSDFCCWYTNKRICEYLFSIYSRTSITRTIYHEQKKPKNSLRTSDGWLLL